MRKGKSGLGVHGRTVYQRHGKKHSPSRNADLGAVNSKPSPEKKQEKEKISLNLKPAKDGIIDEL